jgi:molybdate transport system ATP-binding protein
MSLAATVQLHLGDLDLDVELAGELGETVAVLGPNGAGKTTTLRALAGLTAIDRGRIVLDGAVLDDGGATFVAPERRPVGVVFQDYLLFPHLSVLDNVSFGLRRRGTGRAAARAEAADWLEALGLADRAGVRPQELSGGQAQRVALARALAPRPRLLLLDEPLAALDQSARAAVRRDLRARLTAFPGVRVLVTHDPVDAAVLADRLVILERGRVTQSGTFAEIAARPRSRYVAELVGVNLLEGTAAGDHVDLGAGRQLVVPDAGSGRVLALIHPHSVVLQRERPAGSARNVWPGTVAGIEPLGERVRVRIDGPVPLVAEITPAARRDLDLDAGGAVYAAVKATDVTVFPA